MTKSDNVPGVGKPRNSVSTSTYDSLVLALRNFDEKVRIDAVQRLAELKDHRAISLLLGRFQNDKSPKVRYYAIEELYKLKDSLKEVPVWSVLAGALNKYDEEDENVRAKIAEILGLVNEVEYSDSLVAALSDDSKIVWQAAAHSLGLIKDTDIIEELIKNLNGYAKHSYDAKDAAPYILALIEIGAIAVEDVLLSIEDKNINFHNPQYREYKLVEGYEQLFNDRVEIISTIGGAALPEIKKIISADECDDSVLFLISKVLANIGGIDSLKILCSLAKSKRHEAIRWVSINGLKGIYIINPEMVFRTLIQIVEKDNVSEVKEEAIEGLAILKNPQATPLLGSILLDSGDQYLRLASAVALGDIMDPFALDVLVSALGTDRDEAVRVAAATALGKINNRDAIPFLEATLRDDPSTDVQNAVKQSLDQYK